MILRRITDAIREQHWVTVLIELVIVVAGVFIGIQVSNWSEALGDRAIVAGHLSEIAEDLQTHLELHDALYGSAVARIAAADYLYAEAWGRTLPDTIFLSTEEYALPPAREIPEDQRDNLMGWLNLVRISVGSRSGYEPLISSGHLGLMKNRELARDVQLYYGLYDDLLDTNNVFRQFRNDGAAVLYTYGISIFDERPEEELVALTRDNEQFAAYVRTMREWAIVHAKLLEVLRVETAVLLSAINAELETKS